MTAEELMREAKEGRQWMKAGAPMRAHLQRMQPSRLQRSNCKMQKTDSSAGPGGWTMAGRQEGSACAEG
jgi:hypothetical protein